MKKVLIEKAVNADTRSNEVLSYAAVLRDTYKHIDGVRIVMDNVCAFLKNKAMIHDWTKIEYFDEFYDAFLATKDRDVDFKALPWWQIHLNERHHLNEHCPDDVNLFDILEMLVDCVVAGKARTGEVFPVKLSDEILQKAIKNTIKELTDSIIVE